MKELYVRAFRANLFGAFAIGGVLFVAAGTVQYWQAWVFLVVFVGASALATIYLAIHDSGAA